MLFNQSRADDILAREGLDGLIAAPPINQYYLTEYWGLFNSAGAMMVLTLASTPAIIQPWCFPHSKFAHWKAPMDPG